MLVQELRAELNPYFTGVPAWLILWLDETGEWDGVVDHLQGEFHVLRYRGSLMELKATVEFAWAEGKKPRFVLYVPGVSCENLGVLKEYEFLGKVFDAPILTKLREWGMEVDREAAQEVEPMLPLLAREHARASREVWRDILAHPLKYLVKPVDVLELLADPPRKHRDLAGRSKWDIFQVYVRQAYGGPEPSATALDTWAEEFTVYLILTEAYYRNGCPGDFPSFKIRPAEEVRHRACLELLDTWLHHATFKDDFKRLSRRVEGAYDLSQWAEGLEDPPRSEASLKIAQAWSGKMLAKAQAAGTVAALRSLLDEHETAIDTLARQFWSREGDVQVWTALQMASSALRGAAAVDADLAQCGAASDFAQRYADRWWETDRDYRKLRARFDAVADLHDVVAKVRQAHNDTVRRMNAAFVGAVKASKDAGLGLQTQAGFWSANISEGKGVRAVLFVDALRYEMWRDLEERLRTVDGDVEVEPMVAALPTVTPVGMSMLCPGNISLAVEGNQWRIGSDVQPGGNLLDREARKRIIKKKHPKAKFFDLGELVQARKEDIEKTNLVVGFSKEWDTGAHPQGTLTLSAGVVDGYLDLIARVVFKLGSFGVEKVWLVSDHGFIIIDDRKPGDEITVPTQPEPLLVGDRYLVASQEISMPGALFLDLQHSAGLKVGLPAGLGVFGNPGQREYFHGGLSLQEAVLPVVSVRYAGAEARYSAVLQVDERITNLIFPVRVLRKDPTGFLLPPQARSVILTGVLIHEGVEQEVIRTDDAPVQVDSSNTVVEVRLRMRPDITFTKGDRLRLSLLDAQTEELLDHREVILDVESNF